MNILVDIRLLASGKVSGIEEYTRNLLGPLIASDRANSYSLFYNSLRPGSPILEVDAPLVRYHIPNKAFDASLRFFNYPKIDRLAPTDLIFSPHFNIIARSPNVAHVLTIHDLSFMHHPEFFSLRKRFWHWLQDYAKQIRAATHIIAVSDYTKQDIVNALGIDPKKITRVYSGIDPMLKQLPADDPGLVEFKTRHAIQRPFILYLGTLEPRKNIVAAIRAFNTLKQRRGYGDYGLLLAGARGWLYNEILSAIASSPFKQDIRILGEVSVRDRLYLYNSAEVFVYPSFFEGFGFPPLEAQACGLPVVCSSRSSLPEIVGNSALMVDPWRIDELAYALFEILDRRPVRERLIREGTLNTRRFGWHTAAEQTMNVFNAVSRK